VRIIFLHTQEKTGSDSGGLMSPMSKPLEWTERSETEHDAHRDKAHYIVHNRPEGKWSVPIFSMFTDGPDQVKEKLGEYVVTTLEDGKQLSQALADQRGRILVMIPRC
jgi:hypothetical protein